MTNIEGTTLSQRITRGPIYAEEALRIAGTLAEVLRRLHDRGVVHGALEPNLVVLEETGALVRDGLAANQLTPYAAPEQLQDKPADIRSDIFAFGVILYEMLSGRRPFAGEGGELRAAILEQEPPPLAAQANGLARIVSRCLAKAPGQRWQRMQNVQMELKLVSVMARRSEQPRESQEQRLRDMLRKEIEQVEERLTARLSALEVAAFELRAKLETEGERLSAANRETEAVRNDVAALAGRVEESEQGRKAGAAAAAWEVANVTGRLDRIDQALSAHASSLESLDASVTQSDDLIERLVDAFDGLEHSLAAKGEQQTATAGM